MGCWLCGFGEFCLWAFVSSTVKENTTTITCIIRPFYASGASNSEAGTWQARKCQVSWLGLSTPPSPQEACPKEPNPSLQEFLGHQSQDAGPEFPVSLGGVSHLSLGGVSHLPLWGAPIHLWGVSSPLEPSPLEGGLPSALGVSCLPLRGLSSPLGEISCLPLGGLPSPPGAVSHLFLGGSPISLGGLLSVLGEPPLGRVSHLFLGVLPSPLMGVSHPPLGGLLSPLESPLGGSPISSGGLLSPLEGVYHPPLGRSPVSPRGSPLGCLPFFLGCTALGRMILAHFCPLLPVRPLHSSGPA